MLVCEKVCQRPHVLGNQSLVVQTYSECIGQTFNTKEESRLQSTVPLVLEGLDLRKVAYVYRSQDFRALFEKQCDISYGKILWLETPSEKMTVSCTLTKNVEGWDKLVNTWGKNMEECIKGMLDQLHVANIIVIQEIWETVLERTKGIIVADNKKADIMTENDRFTICIVGYKEMVESLKESLQKIISSVKDEIKKENQQGSEVLTLEHYQFMPLSFECLKESVEKEIPEIRVNADGSKNTLRLEGKLVEVMRVKRTLFEKCHQICQASEGKFSKILQDYVIGDKVTTILSDNLNETKNVIWFELIGDEVLLYAFSNDNAIEAAHLLKNSVVECPIEVKPNSSYVLTSEKWKKEVDFIETKVEFDGLLQIRTLADKREIIILTLCHLVDMARKLVENFLCDIAIQSYSIDIHPTILKYFEIHYATIYEEICDRSKEEHVGITMGPNCLTINGTKAGINQTKHEIEILMEKVVWRKHRLQRPGIARHINKEKSASNISEVQKEHKCCIQIGEKSQTNVSTFSNMDSESCMETNADIRGK